MGFNPVDLAFGNMDALRSSNERLRAENAKLRHDLEEANNQAEEVCIENAKLRELVRIGIEYCCNGFCDEEDGCPLYEGRFSCSLTDKARELGVDA